MIPVTPIAFTHSSSSSCPACQPTWPRTSTIDESVTKSSARSNVRLLSQLLDLHHPTLNHLVRNSHTLSNPITHPRTRSFNKRSHPSSPRHRSLSGLSQFKRHTERRLSSITFIRLCRCRWVTEQEEEQGEAGVCRATLSRSSSNETSAEGTGTAIVSPRGTKHLHKDLLLVTINSTRRRDRAGSRRARRDSVAQEQAKGEASSAWRRCRA
jgi:hypothetical protein